MGFTGFWSPREHPPDTAVAERVSKSVHVALIRTRSPEFEKPLSRKRELCAGVLTHSLLFAGDLCSNMGWSMDESVRRKVGHGSEICSEYRSVP